MSTTPTTSEVEFLRAQLAQSQSEKARLEMDLLNQINTLAQQLHEKDDERATVGEDIVVDQTAAPASTQTEETVDTTTKDAVVEPSSPTTQTEEATSSSSVSPSPPPAPMLDDDTSPTAHENTLPSESPDNDESPSPAVEDTSAKPITTTSTEEETSESNIASHPPTRKAPQKFAGVEGESTTSRLIRRFEQNLRDQQAQQEARRNRQPIGAGQIKKRWKKPESPKVAPEEATQRVVNTPAPQETKTKAGPSTPDLAEASPPVQSMPSTDNSNSSNDSKHPWARSTTLHRPRPIPHLAPTTPTAAQSTPVMSNIRNSEKDRQELERVQRAQQVQEDQIQGLEKELERQYQVNKDLMNDFQALMSDMEEMQEQNARQFQMLGGGDALQERNSVPVVPESPQSEPQHNDRTMLSPPPEDILADVLDDDVNDAVQERDTDSPSQEWTFWKEQHDTLQLKMIETEEALLKFHEKNIQDQLQIVQLESQLDQLKRRQEEEGQRVPPEMTTASSSQEMEESTAFLQILEEQVNKLCKTASPLETGNDGTEPIGNRLQRITGRLMRFEEQQHQESEDTKEQISRLEAQVNSLQGELLAAQLNVDTLKATVEANQGMEETVEEMSKLNQESVERQKSMVEKELQAMQLEKRASQQRQVDLEQQVLWLQGTLDEEMEARAKEEEALRTAIHMKDTTIAENIKEKAQMVASMKQLTISKKEEMEELQVELMEVTAKATEQAREIHMLKQKVHDQQYVQEQSEEARRMRDRIQELEHQVARRRRSTVDPAENDRLREQLRQSIQERDETKIRLRQALEDKSETKTVQVLRERNASLKQEVETQSRKMKKMMVKLMKHGLLPNVNASTSTSGSRNNSEVVESQRLAI